jgi:hypothetical protein
MSKKINKMVLVLAGGGYQWDRQEISCRETWANPSINPEDTKVYFIRANAAACFYDKGVERNDNWQSHRYGKDIHGVMSSRIDVNHDTRTIFVDVADGHAYSMFKFALALQEIRKHFEWNYLVRPNSGSYVNLNVLDMHLDALPKQNLVYAHPINHWGIEYGSGSCFTLSKDLSDVLIANTATTIAYGLQTIMPDDAIIGKILNKPVTHAHKVNVDYNDMMQGDSWFDPKHHHYWFRSTQDDRPHYIVHKKFYGDIK